MARPRKTIDLKELEKLCMMQCTDEEIAAWFGVSRDKIIRRKEINGFCGAYENGKHLGKVSLRRLQWQAAQKGNITMLIWLGKQILGQRDNLALTGDSGTPLIPRKYKITFGAHEYDPSDNKPGPGGTD
jgi:hypothetical protein